MARLFGCDYTRNELLARVGDISQVGGIKKVRLSDGMEDGVEAYDVRTGTGFTFTVLAGRGMGIGGAEFQGRPLAWRSATGDVAPQFYEAEGKGFLRGFGGGLLVTCGLTNVGSRVEENSALYPVHGRVHSIPAREVSYGGEWVGDDYVMTLVGKVREAAVFGETLELTRKITARLGESVITIEDTVENLGHEPADHMILYHINAGFPVLDAGARLLARSKTVTPRDPQAAEGLDDYAVFDAPTPGYREQVFYHDLESDDSGLVTVAAVKDNFGFYVTYSKEELPVFVQWKQCGMGTYVMGMEPANCHVEGRQREREMGTLQSLEPGEARHYRLEIGVISSKD